jgi:ABC-type siderophore export system fused ATPase/permease subunit
LHWSATNPLLSLSFFFFPSAAAFVVIITCSYHFFCFISVSSFGLGFTYIKVTALFYQRKAERRKLTARKDKPKTD